MSADFVNGTPFSPAVGSTVLVVRKDTPADQAGTDGYVGIPQLDSGGALRVTEEGGIPTYLATSQFSCDSTATDIALIAGNANKVVKVLGVKVSTTATAAATGNLTLVRRSAANTAGTSAAASVGKADSRNVAASSTPIHYTVHPNALGASAGVVDGKRIVQQAAGTPPATEVFFDLRPSTGGQGVRLNGVAEILALNAEAALGGGGNSWVVSWIYTESPTTA